MLKLRLSAPEGLNALFRRKEVHMLLFIIVVAVVAACRYHLLWIVPVGSFMFGLWLIVNLVCDPVYLERMYQRYTRFVEVVRWPFPSGDYELFAGFIIVVAGVVVGAGVRQPRNGIGAGRADIATSTSSTESNKTGD